MKALTTYIFLLLSGVVLAQQIYIDKGVQVNGLWCFPTHNNPHQYQYLSTKARLALDEDKHPKFSFIRYITTQPSENSTSSVTEAGGGGILHFLVLYETPQEQVEVAQDMMREQFKNEDIVISGPILFDSAHYTLVSSILDKEANENKTHILKQGFAPVMENSRIALSFEVDPLNSKLLLESFKMDTPDISIIFDLGFSGLTEAYDATLEIDWSEVKRSKSFGAGGNIYFVSADVEMGLDELFKNNSIKLTTNGEDHDMEALLNTVYDKLLELMFKPIEPALVPEEQRGGLMDALTNLIGQNGALSSSNTFNFGINASFQMKELRTKGKSNLIFNGRTTVNRTHYITFNIGDLYKNYGDDTRFFKDVALWDPAFQQREVFVGIDGDLEKEFEEMLNSVTLTMRKKHANGNETLEEVIINKERFKSYEGNLSLRYLNHGDTLRTEWLNYEYKTYWKFKGGGGFESGWLDENSAMINLYVPFKRRTIELDGDLESLKNEVRAISVKIEYPFFDQIKQDRLTIPTTANLNDISFKVTLPNTSEEVHYTITWLRREKPNLIKKGIDKFGLIFIDEIPQE